MTDGDELAPAGETVEQLPVTVGEFAGERLGSRRDDPVGVTQVRLLVRHGRR